MNEEQKLVMETKKWKLKHTLYNCDYKPKYRFTIYSIMNGSSVEFFEKQINHILDINDCTMTLFEEFRFPSDYIDLYNETGGYKCLIKKSNVVYGIEIFHIDIRLLNKKSVSKIKFAIKEINKKLI